MPNETLICDLVFKALAHPARRAVIEQLSRGDASMTELAEPANMALPSFLQHLKVLEEAGLIESEKVGRTRTYQLNPERLIMTEHWMDKHHKLWVNRLNQLDHFLLSQKEQQSK
ncbi:MAG TPA: metalloregulator ArsR/SmtB family transcription factor [Fimbriimonas sp.]|nr:metalloregulator ArsR/SmtB family transcription factor [Fimbriimonas sp.]